MKLFMKKRVEETFANEGSNIPRVKNLSEPELMSWFNSTLMSLGVSFDNWRYREGSTTEVSDSLNALSEIWKEIKHRRNG